MTSKISKATLSAALIVKNESKNLESCLNSLTGWVDDIVILDSGSEDNTREIAEKYTEHFYLKSNWQGFGLQRQAAQQYVKNRLCIMD